MSIFSWGKLRLIIKVAQSLFFATLFYGCLLGGGIEKPASESGGSEGGLPANINITAAKITGNQLIINGSNFEGVTSVVMTSNARSFSKTFKVISASFNQLITEAIDDVKIPVNAALDLILSDAHGQASFPIEFALQDGAVTTATIADGSVALSKLAPPPISGTETQVFSWDPIGQRYFFAPYSGAGGGGGGVPFVARGTGIEDMGTSIDSSGGTISVDTGTTGDSSVTKIPFFNNQNQIVLDGFSTPPAKLILGNTVNYSIFNDGDFVIREEGPTPREILIIEANKVSINDDLYVKDKLVCVQGDPSCFPPAAGITQILTTAPLTGSGTSGVITIGPGAVNTANNLVQLDSSGRLPLVDGSQLTNIPSMVAPSLDANYPILSGGNDKSLVPAGYKIPNAPCTPGQILKTDASGNFICANDSGGVISFNGRTDAVLPQAGDYSASQISSTPTVNITASNVQDALNELDSKKLALAGGTMTGTVITSSQNGLQLGPTGSNTGEVHFMELSGANYVGFKSADSLGTDIIWTLPSTAGSSGQVLSTNGSNDLSWTTITGGAGGIGDVVGPSSASSTNLASFNGTTGKIIQDSGISSGNLMTMGAGTAFIGNILTTGGGKSAQDSGVALSSLPTMATNSDADNKIILSVNGSKQLVTTNYSVPPTIGTANYILKSNGSTVEWQKDEVGTGDVVGSGTSTVGNLAIYNSSDGKEIKDSGISNGVIATMPIGSLGPNELVISDGIGTGLKSAGYRMPSSIGSATYVLKSDGTNVDWAPDVAGTGDVVGPAIANNNSIVRFDNSGKLIKDSGVLINDTNDISGVVKFTSTGDMLIGGQTTFNANTAPSIFPTGHGNPGQVLQTNGAGILSWVNDNSGGDVFGPGSSTIGTVPVYSDGTGKNLGTSTLVAADVVTMGSNGTGDYVLKSSLGQKSASESTVLVSQIPTMAADAASNDKIILSAGPNKTQKTSDYSIPAAIGSATYILKSNGTNVDWAPDIAGTGDVVGPASAMNNAVARFETGTGKLIKDSGITIDDLNNILGIALLNGKVANNIVTGTGLGVGGNIPVYDGISSTGIADSGKSLTNIPTMAAAATGTHQPIVSAGADKTQMSLGYSIPSTPCSDGQILKADASGNFVCGSDLDTAPPVTKVFGRTGDVVAVGGDYDAAKITNSPAGIIAAITVQQAIDQLATLDSEKLPLVGGTMTGTIITSSQNSLQINSYNTGTGQTGEIRFEDLGNDGLGYVGFKAPDDVASGIIWTLPSVPGTTGQFLTNMGSNKLDWTTIAGGANGLGDVVGPSSSTLNAISKYSDSSGKKISNSGILISGTNDLSGVAGISSSGNMAVGTDALFVDSTNKKVGIGNAAPLAALDVTGTAAISGNTTIGGTLGITGQTTFNVGGSPSTFPNDRGIAGQVLSTNGAGTLSWATDLGGDVVGPTGAVDNHLASFDTATGKLIKDSGLLTANIPIMADPAGTSNTIILSAGNSKDLKSTSFTIPDTICPLGQVLKSDGTNYICQEETPLTEWVAGKDYKVGEIVNTGSDKNWLFKVIQDHTSVDVPADSKAGKLLPIAPPIITTGLQAGGQASLAGNEATVQAGTGYISKYGLSPSAWPRITIVEWPIQTITLPATGIHTLFIDENGVLISVPGLSTRSAQDDTISVGLVDMNLGKIYDRETYPTNPVGQLRGLAFFFGGMTRGLSYAPSVSKELARTAYEVYFWGANSVDPYDPNTKSYNAMNPVQFYEFKQNGPVDSSIKTQLRNVWDNAGTITNLGNKKWGFARIFSTLGEEDYVMYSQAQYNDEAAAKAGAVSTSFIKPLDLSLTKFSSWIVFQEGDNDFSNNTVNTCEPFGCDKIGSAASGGGGLGDVLGPVSSTDLNLAAFSGTSGKVIQDSGLLTANIPTMAAAASATFQPIVSAGADKTQRSAGYSIPSTICPDGQILKSDGTNFGCSDDEGGVISFNGRTDIVMPLAGDYDAAKITNSPAGIITAITVQQAIDQLATLDSEKLPLVGGTMTGTIKTSSQNALQLNPYNTGTGQTGEIRFEDLGNDGLGYVGFKAPDDVAGGIIWTLPSAPGTIGQFLTNMGANQLDWTTIAGGANGIGNVIGPSPSTQFAIPKFSDTSGKNLSDSGITISGTNDLSGIAGFTSSGNMTVGTDALFVDSTNKKIGIGNAAPLETLDVTGTAAISGNTTIGGTFGITGQTTFNVGINSSTFPTVRGTSGQFLSTNGSGALSWASGNLGDVVGPAISASGTLASFNGTSGKLIQDTGIISANIPTMAFAATGTYRPIVSAGSNKTQMSLGYSIPSTPCSNGQILKSDGSGNFSCADDVSGVTSFNSRTGAVVPIAGDYTATLITNTAAGNIAATTVQAALNELDTEKLALAGGTMTGAIITSSQNAVQLGPYNTAGGNTGEERFMELLANGTNYVGFKAPDVIAANKIWILPAADGASGTVLATNGSGTLSWTAAAAPGSLRDQTGTTYSLISGDCGNSVTLSNASAISLSLSSLPVGCVINVIQGGAGVVTVVAGGGISPQNAFGLFRTRAQYSVIGIQVLSTSAAVISGDVN